MKYILRLCGAKLQKRCFTINTNDPRTALPTIAMAQISTPDAADTAKLRVKLVSILGWAKVGPAAAGPFIIEHI